MRKRKMASTDIQLDEKVKVRVTEPKSWKVIMLNDDHTPMDFVTSILIEIFKHNVDSAKRVMLQVHETGSGVAGVYGFEIAEAKAVEATNSARAAGYPLQIKLEEE